MRAPSAEALGGATWPFPVGICTRCLVRLLKDDPDIRSRVREFQKALNRKMLAGAEEALRGGALHVMNWADLVAKRFGPK